MGSGFTSLFKVSINFKESHTFFPTIVQWILLILLAVIIIVIAVPRIRDIRSGKRKVSFFTAGFDKTRFLGTILLTVIYFLAMDFVGSYFPNMGLGFLLMSIPFMIALSLLYSHDIDRKKLLWIGLNSVISPGVAWYVLGHLFNISLP